MTGPSDMAGMEFFGQRWDAPAFDDAREIPPPVGEECLFCHEAITAGDDGCLTRYADAQGFRKVPAHIECWLRSILGDVFHVTGNCSCQPGGGLGHDDRPYREQARALMVHLRAQQQTQAN